MGLSAGLALTSLCFFIGEMRQAGNDGPLAFFTTLALYAAWRRLHGDGAEIGITPGRQPWNLVFYLAVLGLGFLAKGPIILVLVALTVVAYLATLRKLHVGLVRLVNGWGLLLFLLLALSWPVPVLLSDPNAAQVWLLEMGQKAGSAGAVRHRPREVLAVNWGGDGAVGRHRDDGGDRAAAPRGRESGRGSGSRGGGRWATWRCSASGRSPSRTITSPACRAWRS